MHKIISVSIFVLICLIIGVGKCHAQKKDQPKDTVVSFIINSDQDKYLSDLEKEISRLNADRFKALLFIIGTKDSTYISRLIVDPVHERKRIFLKLKK